MQTLLCAVIALMVFVNTGSACAEGSDSALNTIVTLSADRLELAQKIALAKWDRGLAVEDPSRETVVILDAANRHRPQVLMHHLRSGSSERR